MFKSPGPLSGTSNSSHISFLFLLIDCTKVTSHTMTLHNCINQGTSLPSLNFFQFMRVCVKLDLARTRFLCPKSDIFYVQVPNAKVKSHKVIP